MYFSRDVLFAFIYPTFGTFLLLYFLHTALRSWYNAILNCREDEGRPSKNKTSPKGLPMAI